MITDDQQDRIDDYLTGRHPDPAAFERALQQDPQLQLEMNATRMALDAIQLGEDQRLKDRLQQLEGSMSTVSAGPTTPAGEQSGARIVQLKPRHKSSWIRYAAAAAVLLLAVAYFVLRPAELSGPQLAMANFVPDENIAFTITKGGSDDVLATAYVAYEGGDYATAERELAALADPRPADRYYLAQSLLAQQKFAGALEVFRSLPPAAEFNLAPETTYYTAVALVGLERTDEARALLEGITTDANHERYAAATRLLASL